MVYIGETKQTIKERVYQHLQTILKFKKNIQKQNVFAAISWNLLSYI
jgi:hypothetical protein